MEEYLTRMQELEKYRYMYDEYECMEVLGYGIYI